MPFVHVHWRSGRSADQKEKVAEGIREVLREQAGVPPEKVWVKFSDSEEENFIVGEPDEG